MHPHRAKAKAMHAAKIKGFAAGGSVGTGTDLYEPKVKMGKGTEGEGKYAPGGMVMGMKAPKRPHMGKAKKPGTHINIINMPHGGAGAGAPPMPGPGVGMIPPPVRPIAPAPGPMGMPPPGVGPGPMMRKHGGRVEEIKRMVHEHETNMHKGHKLTKLKAKGGEVDHVSRANTLRKPTGPADPVSKATHLPKAYAAGGAVGEVDKVSKANPLRKPTLGDGPVSKASPIAKIMPIVKGLKGNPPGGEKNPDPVSKAEPIAKMKPLGMRAGAGDGTGFLQKANKYGRNVGKSAKSSSTS